MVVFQSAGVRMLLCHPLVSCGWDAKLGVPGNKRMLCFVDDLNMPRKDTYGSQPPLELIRPGLRYVPTQRDDRE